MDADQPTQDSLLNKRKRETTDTKMILGISKDKSLVAISPSSNSARVLTNLDKHVGYRCSFSPLIQNRYIYMVGGIDCATDTFFCDLSDLSIHKVPSVKSEQDMLVLIALGSKLFSFPLYTSLNDTFCEILDTASQADWRYLESVPSLSFHQPRDAKTYLVHSYAIDRDANSLFLSLGDARYKFAVCYNDSKQMWSNVSKTALPFYKEGKFTNGVCYGIPAPTHSPQSPSIALVGYKLAVDDWESTDGPKISCQMVAKYPLPIPNLFTCNFVTNFSVSPSLGLSMTRTTVFPENQSLLVYSFQLPLERGQEPLYYYLRKASGQYFPLYEDTVDPESSGLVDADYCIPLPCPLEVILGDYNP